VTATPEDADVETASRDYAARFDSPVGRWMLATQERVTLDLLGAADGRSVIDVGGGHGQTAPALASLGFRATVLVSSDAAISDALRPAVDSGRVRFVVGDLRDPGAAGEFDVVLSYRLLAHARDLPGLIAGMTGAARRSVIVDYATTRSFNAIADALFGAKKRVEKNTRPFEVFSDDRIEAAFENNGFRRAARVPQFFWPMALHRAIGNVAISRAAEGVARALGLVALLGSPVIARFDRRTPS
jgi:2-polyprenyl-3-methyl-5-hydroxy-6-metoxy-1,4-benzoquinol methylase